VVRSDCLGEEMKQYTRVLTIAGSDSGGGAGIQADLKAISACGCFGMSAITAITAQNTCGVTDIHPIPISTIESQIRAVLDDIGVDAIKIGMLHSAEVTATVAKVIKEYSCEKVVLDPVMVATSGDCLIEKDGVAVMKSLLFPAVSLITPNVPEAEILSGKKIEDNSDVLKVAEYLSQEFSLSVLVKTGHLENSELVDVLVVHTKSERYTFSNTRIDTKNCHGTGCSLSSAIASYLARGNRLDMAVQLAEEYLHGALEEGAAYKIGKGHGPVHHFYKCW
jgi:hydroxymethylpyrimidine/phosphomethylpyrimidine kinase